MNFFVYPTVAERYARYRPYTHPLVIEKIKTYLQIERPLGLALDVGCGTGQSTTAVKEIAESVIGADTSTQMLAVAERKPGIQYVRGPAEALALKSNSVDLLTTSLAYHWFDRERFFAEAQRVLNDGAWLVIFNNWFTGQMKNEPRFEAWFGDVYMKRYPTPTRNSAPMTLEFARQHGFDFAHHEDYENEVQFTVEKLAAYLITQSNVIAATEQGEQKVDDVYEWLVAQIVPFFRSDKASFVFEGYIWYLQKM